jgi:hypothetical protein
VPGNDEEEEDEEEEEEEEEEEGSDEEGSDEDEDALRSPGFSFFATESVASSSLWMSSYAVCV